MKRKKAKKMSKLAAKAKRTKQLRTMIRNEMIAEVKKEAKSKAISAGRRKNKKEVKPIKIDLGGGIVINTTREEVLRKFS